MFLCREGTLKIGDRIMAMNGVNVSGSSLAEGMMMLRHSQMDIMLLVEYDVSVMGEFYRGDISLGRMNKLLPELDQNRIKDKASQSWKYNLVWI